MLNVYRGNVYHVYEKCEQTNKMCMKQFDHVFKKIKNCKRNDEKVFKKC